MRGNSTLSQGGLIWRAWLLLACLAGLFVEAADPPEARLRVIVETDAGGDPDDEQSLVRFLLYANEWDVEGIIANRPVARERENLNPLRTGLEIVQAQLKAYAQCYPRLVQHDSRYPAPAQLWSRAVAGYEDQDAAVEGVLRAIDSPDPRPIWFCNWGTDRGSASSNLKRALDRLLRERGPAGYAKGKSRLRLSSYDRFEQHTTTLEPPFELWVNTFAPELEGKRWYHRFSALTATAGGFDVQRDVLREHGPLGAFYPTNTTHPQKEGDSMTFLYLIPIGMNDVNEPTWGSWAGRYGPNEHFPGRAYFWANQADTWRGKTHRDQTLLRWAADLQNDFRARLDWCVRTREAANHPPKVCLNGVGGATTVRLTADPGTRLSLSAGGSADPDGQSLEYEWFAYPEAGSYTGQVQLGEARGKDLDFQVPSDAGGKSLHLIVRAKDSGEPPLARYRRAVVQVTGARKDLQR